MNSHCESSERARAGGADLHAPESAVQWRIVSILAIIAFANGFVPIAGAQTADIVYSTTELSSDAAAGTSTWQYDYTITNTTPAGAGLPAIDEFTIYYALGTFENMTVASTPGNWSPFIAQPDPILQADGYLDAEANDAGLAAGASVTNFSVDFTFLGQGTPGAQVFNIVDFNDPNTYVVPLQVGLTRLATPTTVPEIDASSAVGAITLLIGGLLVLSRRTGAKSAGIGDLL